MLRTLPHRIIQATLWVLGAVLLLGVPAWAGSPDFSVGTKPGKQTVNAGQSASFTVSVSPKFGFNDSVALSASNLPTGASASFNPTAFVPLKNDKNSTLTVFTDFTTPPGSYAIQVTVMGGGITHTAVANLVVKSTNKAYLLLSAVPVTQTVQEGQTTTYTVTAQGVNGYASPVTLSVSSGLPAGAGWSFSPNPVIPSATGADSTLTITTTDPMPVGTFTLVVTGIVAGKIAGQTAVTLVATVKAGSAPAGIYALDAFSGWLFQSGDLASAPWTFLPLFSMGFVANSVMVGPDSRIYVAAGGVLRFDDMAGANLIFFTSNANSGLQVSGARDVWVAPDMRIYVAAGGRIIRMDDFSGTTWTQYLPPLPSITSFPSSVTVGPDGRIYFTITDLSDLNNGANNKVYRMDDMSGTNLVSYGSSGCLVDTCSPDATPIFCRPWKVRFGPDNRLYVADQGNPNIATTGNFRIVAVNTDSVVGTGWSYYGHENCSSTSSPPPFGTFTSVYGVAVGTDGKIYVPDRYGAVVIRVPDWATSPDRTVPDVPHAPFDVFVR